MKNTTKTKKSRRERQGGKSRGAVCVAACGCRLYTGHGGVSPPESLTNMFVSFGLVIQ